MCEGTAISLQKYSLWPWWDGKVGQVTTLSGQYIDTAMLTSRRSKPFRTTAARRWRRACHETHLINARQVGLGWNTQMSDWHKTWPYSWNRRAKWWWRDMSSPTSTQHLSRPTAQMIQSLENWRHWGQELETLEKVGQLCGAFHRCPWSQWCGPDGERRVLQILASTWSVNWKRQLHGWKIDFQSIPDVSW